MAEKFAFTIRRVKEIEPPEKGRCYYRDSKAPGLELCVSKTGSKTFYFYRRIDGQPSRIRLGTSEELTVDMAREATKAIIGEIAVGKNPAADRRLRKQEKTLSDVWDDWFTVHCKPRKKTWKDDERQYKKYLAPFHSTKLSRLTSAKIAKWHAKLGEKRPVQANRAKTLLSTLMNYAVKLGILTANPCRSVSSFPEQSRERFLLPSEMKTFFDALAKAGEPWHDFFQLALFTGARRSNVQSMRWDEIDFERMTWNIPGKKTKNGRPVTIALSPPAILILKSRLAVATKNPYVFASHGKKGHIVEPKGAWKLVREESGLKDLRMHDLRRSLGSWQAQAGASLAVIGASLGHADLKSTQVYSRLQIDPVRISVESAVVAMQRAAGLIEDKTIDVKPEETDDE